MVSVQRWTSRIRRRWLPWRQLHQDIQNPSLGSIYNHTQSPGDEGAGVQLYKVSLKIAQIADSVIHEEVKGAGPRPRL